MLLETPVWHGTVHTAKEPTIQIAFLGRGPVATNLAKLAEAAGHSVEVSGRTGKPSFKAAADAADLIVLAIPYRVAHDLLPGLSDALNGKIFVDATNLLNEDWSPIVPDDGKSGAETIAALLPETHVVKAFNTVFADIMSADGLERDGKAATTFIAGNDEAAVAEVEALARRLGFDPVVAGPLYLARYLEGLAHLNIAIAVGQGGGTQAAILYDRK